MNKTQIAAKQKFLRRLNIEKQAYLSAGTSHLYVAKLFPKKSEARAQLENAAQDAFAWAAEITIQINEVQSELDCIAIPLDL